MSNRRNLQKKTTAFGEPSSEPTKTRASANVAVQPAKRKAISNKKGITLEVKSGANRNIRSKKQTESATKNNPVVGVVNPRRGEIPKIIYENYQSPPFNRFYILAFAMGILMAVAGYSAWQYTTEKVSEKIEVVSESPRVHSWINKVTNKKPRKFMQIKKANVKKTKRTAARRNSR